MPEQHTFLALDLGASSGRGVIGRFDGARLALEEIHRFANGPLALPNKQGVSLHWNTLGLFEQIKQALTKAVRCCEGRLTSLGIDTWGVDFGLLDEQGELIGLPFHYRDSRTNGMYEEAFRRVPRTEIFAQTGIQFLEINTLYQLLAMALQKAPALSAAQTLLMTPDLLNYWLTGRQLSERTIASTSQLLNPVSGDWSRPLAARLGLPTHLFPAIVSPGTILGPLLPQIQEETQAWDVAVVAPGCHDTASAVAAVPFTGRDQAYVSSGTWSVIGVEASAPVINEQALDLNFTNEGGVCNTFRLLTNITGLWVIQECRRWWLHEGHELSWEQIVEAARAARAFTAFIDSDAHDFASPGDMPARLRDYCHRTGQIVPDDIGTIARIVFESLALKYRRTLDMLESLLGRRLDVLHIVGGGAQNRLLSQFAANAIGRPVVAGPVEATAAGNVLMQMLATGTINSLAEGRDLLARSFATETLEPRDAASWDDAFGRFTRLLRTAH